MTQRNKKPLIGAVSVLLASAGIYTVYQNRPTAAASPAQRSTQAVEPHPPIESMSAISGDVEGLAAALESNPGHTPILLRMAQMELEGGQPEKAANHLREAVRLEPDNADARLELGRALYELGRIDEAIGQTEEILARDPGHVDALYNLGAIRANQGRLDQAREIWTRAVAAAPDSESGRRSKSGLDTLAGGRTTAIPDIPEHRNVMGGRQTARPASANGSDVRRRVMEFAGKQ
jgi:tetratricopeptide (TPR) repeat protein